MTIGIIGSGALGSNLARAFAKKGMSAVIANRRGPESLADLIREVGPSIKAGTVAQAASADIVIVAVRFEALETALAGLPTWNNRIVVDGTNAVIFLEPGSPETLDPTNPLAAYGIKAIDLGDKQSSEVFSTFVPGARVVKAFNHLEVTALVEPELSGGQRVLFYSGDDDAAKADVRKLIESIGFFPVDLGSLAVGGELADLLGALGGTNFIKV